MRKAARWLVVGFLFVGFSGLFLSEARAADPPAAQHPDINLRDYRGWAEVDPPYPNADTNLPAEKEDKDIIKGIGGETDNLAPQLSTLLGDEVINEPPAGYFGRLYQVYNWDWAKNQRGDLVTADYTGNWGVTLAEINASDGTEIKVPVSGYQIDGEGHQVSVLYATSTDITIAYTANDTAAVGYLIHIVDMNTNPEILAAYEANEKAGRTKLVALPCGYVLGTPKGGSFKLAIRDTGSFIDPRIEKDWWNHPLPPSDCSGDLGTVEPAPPRYPVLEGFIPNTIACTETVDNEFHPLRPYPANACDPLIPMSQDPNFTWDGYDPVTKRYITYSCGNNLTPVFREDFDPYGVNAQYTSRIIDGGYIGNPSWGGAYAHTVCDKEGPFDTATPITCWRTAVFDLTVDLKDTNIGILGNTQDQILTDDQKVNYYLSYYLTGVPQIADQIPLGRSGIDRLINYSGPLRKLLPWDLQNVQARSTIAGYNDVNGETALKEDVHDYIVGCKKDIDLRYAVDAFKDAIDTAVKGAGISFRWGPLRIAEFAQKLYEIITNPDGSVPAACVTVIDALPGGASRAQIRDRVAKTACASIANEVADIGGEGVEYLRSIADLINSLSLDAAEACTSSEQLVRLSEYNKKRFPPQSDRLPPDPRDYDNFADYWKHYLRWRGFTVIPLVGGVRLPFTPFANQSVWASLFQNIPLTSVEDTAGEYTFGVFQPGQTTANMQASAVDWPQVSRLLPGLTTADAQIIIKDAQVASDRTEGKGSLIAQPAGGGSASGACEILYDPGVTGCEESGPYGEGVEPGDLITYQNPYVSNSIQVSSSITGKIDDFIESAQNDGFTVAALSGYRTRAQQAAECAQGDGAPAEYSQHRTGRAVDLFWVVGSDVRELPQALIDKAQDLGLTHQFPSDTPHFCVP